MKDTIIDELQRVHNVEELVSFNELNIAEKLQKNAFLYEQYYNFYLREKHILDQLNEMKDRLMGKLYDKFRFNDERNLDRREIEKFYIPADETYIKIQQLILKQQVKADFFEIVAKAIDKMSWNMRNFLETQRI
jgi:hypothetical protein